MKRKEFLQKSLFGAAAVAAATAPIELFSSCAPKNKTELKLSFQEGTAPGKSLNEKFDYMENLGIVGFEPGGRNLAARVEEIQSALKGRNIKVSAICAGFSGFNAVAFRNYQIIIIKLRQNINHRASPFLYSWYGRK